MIIHYDTIEEMVDIVEQLVKRGLNFTVFIDQGRIELGGGY
jgi:hypothetical protein